jgi:hypothetical protein
MEILEQLLEVISDPYNGMEEGVDFWVDEEGLIQVQGVRTAAMVMRKANTSGQFKQTLVKVGQKGDSILLWFDTLLDVPPVYTAKIGFKGDVLAEVKKDESGKFCIYINKKRQARLFSKLSSTKQTIKLLDKELRSAVDIPEDLDY